jgi:hypothetical protein
MYGFVQFPSHKLCKARIFSPTNFAETECMKLENKKLKGKSQFKKHRKRPFSKTRINKNIANTPFLNLNNLQFYNFLQSFTFFTYTAIYFAESKINVKQCVPPFSNRYLQGQTSVGTLPMSNSENDTW